MEKWSTDEIIQAIAVGSDPQNAPVVNSFEQEKVLGCPGRPKGKNMER